MYTKLVFVSVKILDGWLLVYTFVSDFILEAQL